MSGNKILIVDDELDVLTVLGARLSKSGYSVIKADNGKDALIMAKKEHPDLILLDIMMPDCDGGIVAQNLKNDPVTKDIPVIFLTCLVTKDEEAKVGHAIAGNFFIAKPYDPEKLLSEIKIHLLR